MTSCSLRPPMPWSEAIVAIGRGKRVWTGFAARSVERGAWPWTCSENHVPKAGIKPLRPCTRCVGDTHDPESLLQCPYLACLLMLVEMAAIASWHERPGRKP